MTTPLLRLRALAEAARRERIDMGPREGSGAVTLDFAPLVDAVLELEERLGWLEDTLDSMQPESER